jgi:hypothetical protein
MRAQEKQKRDWPDGAGVGVLITEMDGSMLPVVEVAEPVAGAASVDGRKTRQVSWKEARLALAHEPGSMDPLIWRDRGKRGASRRAAGGLRPGGEAGPGSMGWGMGRPGLPSRWRRSLAAKCSIWSISITCATTFRRPETGSGQTINWRSRRRTG